MLISRGVYKTVAVVVRYFGGTLLGTGGLVRSYTKAAQEALQASLVIEKYEAALITLKIDYSLYGAVQNFLTAEELPPSESDFSDRVSLIIPVPAEREEDILNRLTDLTQGRCETERNKDHLWLEKTSEISLS